MRSAWSRRPSNIETRRQRRREGFDCIALVLRGGGPVVGYQGGVYQALHEAELEPDWIIGGSTGAIISVLIAGNRPEERCDRIKKYCEIVDGHSSLAASPNGDAVRKLRSQLSDISPAFVLPQEFFEPSLINGGLGPFASVTGNSLAAQSRLRTTLEKLVDFEVINGVEKLRLVLGPVDDGSGNFIYFDNRRDEIGVEQVLASVRTPPPAPMMVIDSAYYLSHDALSSTPLLRLLDYGQAQNILVFQVDLGDRSEILPRSVVGVEVVRKMHSNAGRAWGVDEYYVHLRKIQEELYEALCSIADNDLTEEQRQMKADLAGLPTVDIVQLAYRPRHFEFDKEQSTSSRHRIKDPWREGYRDAQKALQYSKWLKPTQMRRGIHFHDANLLDD